jgi:NTE family protein
MKKITHIVFSGNALKSLCLCGILRYLYFYNLDKHIRDVSATSMGAFFALAFALKIPIERLEQIIYDTTNNTNITHIHSNSFYNLINSFGLHSSVDYLKYLREYIKEIYNQDDLTFLELSKKTGINIYISTTEIDSGNNIIFNVNDYPDVSVIDAVAASMCLPIISKPIIINNKYYIDGFLTNNFPIEVFSHINNNNILGVGVYNETEHKLNPISLECSIYNYYYRLFLILYNNTTKLCFYNKILKADFLLIKSYVVKSIFDIDITDDYIDLSISKEIIDNLILQGYKEINDYMINYDNNNLDLNLDDKS